MVDEFLKFQILFAKSPDLKSRLLLLGNHAKNWEDPGLNLFNLYRRGDLQEKYCIGRFLNESVLGNHFQQTAQMILRTNSDYVLSSLLYDNDFPEKHFDHTLFKQLVLKGLFLDLDLSRLKGLKTRTDSKIIQSALDYFTERKIAHRPLPKSATLIFQINQEAPHAII